MTKIVIEISLVIESDTNLVPTSPKKSDTGYQLHSDTYEGQF